MAQQCSICLEFNSIEAFNQTLANNSNWSEKRNEKALIYLIRFHFNCSEKRNEKDLIYLIRFQFTKYRLKPAPAPVPIPGVTLTGGSVIGTNSGDISGSVLQPVRYGTGRDGPIAHPYSMILPKVKVKSYYFLPDSSEITFPSKETKFLKLNKNTGVFGLGWREGKVCMEFTRERCEGEGKPTVVREGEERAVFLVSCEQVRVFCFIWSLRSQVNSGPRLALHLTFPTGIWLCFSLLTSLSMISTSPSTKWSFSLTWISSKGTISVSSVRHFLRFDP
ncbi:hypothetical protein LXL04_020518 [Taraxacum kok-saghyz]